MKSLEKEGIEQLLSIVPNYPATRILEINDGGEDLSLELKRFSKNREFEYLLDTVDEEFYNRAKELYSDGEFCIVHKIKLEQRRYVNMAKQFDFAFITATIPLEFREEFLKKVHSHIKNSGNIILFLPKNDFKLRALWWQSLEDTLFVAINNIDLFKNYEIIIAKKMHGWGKSL
jgi:hypothetical protein